MKLAVAGRPYDGGHTLLRNTGSHMNFMAQYPRTDVFIYVLMAEANLKGAALRTDVNMRV
jgi:hypothetical protein